MTYCGKCGTVITGNFCPNCGEKKRDSAAAFKLALRRAKWALHKDLTQMRYGTHPLYEPMWNLAESTVLRANALPGTVPHPLESRLLRQGRPFFMFHGFRVPVGKEQEITAEITTLTEKLFRTNCAATALTLEWRGYEPVYGVHSEPIKVG